MANITVWVDPDSCLSSTGVKGGKDVYWLSTALMLSAQSDTGTVSASAMKILKQLLSPWLWLHSQTDAAATVQHPRLAAVQGATGFGVLKGKLDDLWSANLTGTNIAWLGMPAASKLADPTQCWPGHINHLARLPAPIPQALGLIIVQPYTVAAGSATPGLALQWIEVDDGSGGVLRFIVDPPAGTPIDVDTITVKTAPTALPSLSPDLLAQTRGLVAGKLRLVDSTNTTTRNWLGDFQRRLARAADPWVRLAELYDANVTALMKKGDTASLATVKALTKEDFAAASKAALVALVATLHQNGSLVLREMATTLDTKTPIDEAAVAVFTNAWTANLAAPLNAFVTDWTGIAAPPISADRNAAFVTATVFDQPQGFANAARARFTSQSFRQALAAVLVQALPASAGPVDYKQNVETWLGNAGTSAAGAPNADCQRIDLLLTTLLPIEASRAMYSDLMVQARTGAPAADSPYGPDGAKIENAFPGIFTTGLKQVFQWDTRAAPPVPDASFADMAKSLLPGLFAAPDAIDSVSDGGISLRVDEILVADAPAPPAGETAANPNIVHRLYDGCVVAVQRSQQGLIATSADCASLDALIGSVSLWGPAAVCMTGDISVVQMPTPTATGAKSPPITVPLGQQLLVPAAVPFSRPQSSDPTPIRRAISTYRGDYKIPHIALAEGAGGPPPSEATWFRYFRPAAAPPLPPMAYGQIVRLRAGYVAPGGIPPAGWGNDSTNPWDTSTLATTFDTQPDISGNDVRSKVAVLLRTVAPGAPRLLAKPDDADGTGLGEALVGANDAAVRPLWKERAKNWTVDQQNRFKGVATCYLDALATGDKAVFYVRPPGLAVGQPKQQATGGDVWRYWTQRDADDVTTAQAKAAQARLDAFASRAATVTEYDDPAVVFPPRLSATGCGGVIVSVMSLANRVGAPIGTPVFVPFDGSGTTKPSTRISVVPAVKDAAGADLTQPSIATPSTGGVTITLPAADPDDGALGLYAVSFQTVVDVNFFPGGADPRFARSVIPNLSTDGLPWAGVGTDPKVTTVTMAPGPTGHPPQKGYALGESLVVFECLPVYRGKDAAPLDHLPSAPAIWQAIDLAQNGTVVTASFDRAAEQSSTAHRMDYVAVAEATWDEWHWDGGPVIEQNLLDLFAGPTVEPAPGDPAKVVRGSSFTTFEQLMMAERGPSGIESSAVVDSNAQSVSLFSRDLGISYGAGYMRTRVTVRSRYEALRLPSDPNRIYLARDGAANTSSGVRWEILKWRSLVIRAKRAVSLPTPKIRAVIPLFDVVVPPTSVTNSAKADPQAAAGFVVMLDQTAFDTATASGLAERLVAEIVIEKLVESGTSGNVETYALNVGMDVIAEPDINGKIVTEPFLAPDARFVQARVASTDPTRRLPDPKALVPDPKDKTKQALWDPLGGTGAIVNSVAVLGETLEPASSDPMMPYASILFDAALASRLPGGASGSELALLPGAMLRVKFRYEPLSQAVDGAKNGTQDAATQELIATQLASPWTEPYWVTLLPKTDHAGDELTLLCSPAGKVRLTVNSGVKTDPLQLWREYSSTLEQPAGPNKRLWGITGVVVEDIMGSQVVRPQVMVYPKFPAAPSNKEFVDFTMPAGTLWQPPAGATVFLQLVEMEEFSTAPPPGDLGAAGALWLGTTEAVNADAADQQDAVCRVRGFGHRFFAVCESF